MDRATAFQTSRHSGGRVAQWLPLSAQVRGRGVVTQAVTASAQVGKPHRTSYSALLLMLAVAALTPAGRKIWKTALVFSPPSTMQHTQSIEVVVVGLDLFSQTPRLELTSVDGQDVTLELSQYSTSVFQKGGVLNLTHLRLGELVRVDCALQRGRPVARSIEIVKTPQALELGPRFVSSP